MNRIATIVEHKISIHGEESCTAAKVICVSQVHAPSSCRSNKRHRSRSITTICQVAKLPSQGWIFQDDHNDEIEFSNDHVGKPAEISQSHLIFHQSKSRDRVHRRQSRQTLQRRSSTSRAGWPLLTWGALVLRCLLL